VSISEKNGGLEKIQASYFIVTFGCQMNSHDSEKIAGVLQECGYTKAGEIEEASLILINTCNVRPKAVQKAYSELGKIKLLKKKNPNLIIGICGCVPQTEKKNVLRRESAVDLVFGTQNIDSLPALLERTQKYKKRQIEILPQKTSFEKHKIIREEGPRAWVTIIEGCNNFCTYCIVPFSRGREKSRMHDEIFSEVTQLAQEGYKEVVLLGQNVNSYGTEDSLSMDFPALLHHLHSIDNLERIRFVTSHPKDFSSEVIEAMRDLPKVCKQIHLPVQSGSDNVLLAMGRKYTSKGYLQKISMLKERVEDVGITTDIIVGFPGETEDDFEETLSLLSEVRYDGVFSFKYSDRPQTKAADMSGKISPEVMHERFSRLLELQKEISSEKNRDEEGKIVKVIVDGPSKNNPALMSGRDEKNKIVHFSGKEFKRGDIVEVKILEGRPNCLIGKIF